MKELPSPIIILYKILRRKSVIMGQYHKLCLTKQLNNPRPILSTQIIIF